MNQLHGAASFTITTQLPVEYTVPYLCNYNTEPNWRILANSLASIAQHPRILTMDSPSGGRFLVGLRRTAFVPFHRSACLVFRTRSEERRVGKECRSRWRWCPLKTTTCR